MPYINLGKEQTDVWPPDNKETETRLDNYHRSRLLFKGKHQEVYERIQRWLEESQSKWTTYIVCNFAGLISKVSADMLFGEGIRVVVDEDPTSDAQKQVNELFLNNKLATLNYEMALSASWRGEVVYKMRYGAMASWKDDVARAIIEPGSPGRFFPVIDGDNIRDLKGGVFGNIKKGRNNTQASEDRSYLKIERHEPGTIYNELWELDEDGKTLGHRVPLRLFPEYADLEEEQDTGYPGLLFTFTPNWRLEDEFWGISDYFDMETLFDELNNRISRVSAVLDKHEAPRLILPPGIMKWDERYERWYVEKEDLEAIEIAGEDDSVRGDLPKYLTWNAQLPAAFDQIDKLLEMSFLVSETSPDAFGMGERGAAESGRALKFRLLRLLAKINRKKLYFDEALREIIYAALKLEAIHGSGVDPDSLDIRIEWSDGIPDDPKEQAEIESIRTGKEPTTSVKSAVRRLDKLEGTALEEELEEMEADRSGSTNILPPETTATPGGGAEGRTDLDLDLGLEEE